MIHPHSSDAYHAERAKLSKRARAIWIWLQWHGRATDRDVMRGMGFSEPNMVRPRITELIAAGMLAEVGEKPCPVTGKTVRIVDVKRSAPAQVELAL